MAFTAIQTSTQTSVSSSNSGNISITAPQQYDIVIVHIRSQSSTAVFTVTDNASNTYVVLPTVTSGSTCHTAVAYALQVNAGATSITVNSDVFTSYRIAASSYRGTTCTTNADVFVGSGTGSGASSASFSTSSVTTASGNLVTSTISTSGLTTITPSTDYVNHQSNTLLYGMYKLSSGTSENSSATLTPSQTNWSGYTVVFAADPPPPPRIIQGISSITNIQSITF